MRNGTDLRRLPLLSSHRRSEVCQQEVSRGVQADEVHRGGQVQRLRQLSPEQFRELQRLR